MPNTQGWTPGERTSGPIPLANLQSCNCVSFQPRYASSALTPLFCLFAFSHFSFFFEAFKRVGAQANVCVRLSDRAIMLVITGEGDDSVSWGLWMLCSLLSSVNACISNGTHTHKNTSSTLPAAWQSSLSSLTRAPPTQAQSVCVCVCGNQHTTLVTGQGL